MENADYLEIYPGSMLEHFQSLSEKPGIPCSGILFLNDEIRNHEVCKLGVHFKLATTETDFLCIINVKRNVFYIYLFQFF